ncbi:hypothetical protein EJ05DRAFT_398700 [Pseudovirgaria hyperparasitica]|uniref:Uncharacterized protein n=1 Tax=Pseudovirgaria hyperparasitica TaxID=470096 RepID=A0A6A6W736_9PEZI|nr:uncharacterized protein EJ05DRAFT_398700 [Pseudovirgaria hyperparasitica]KAF2757726.1 hypothetical protein EJ05DRAFT_398700 [Pseudovirgaria hyperparasitica]
MSPRGPPRSPLQPLSPTRMESLQIPSQQRRPVRSHGSGQPVGQLKLPSLPRFHPANFPSNQNSSASNTPPTVSNTPTAPVSPRMQHKQYSDAQRQLYIYQRELIAANARNHKSADGPDPASPRLCPLGSPGPVTPLELEQQQHAGGYFLAGTGAPPTKTSQNDLVEKLIREEAQRRGDMGHQMRARPVASR